MTMGEYEKKLLTWNKINEAPTAGDDFPSHPFPRRQCICMSRVGLVERNGYLSTFGGDLKRPVFVGPSSTSYQNGWFIMVEILLK